MSCLNCIVLYCAVGCCVDLNRACSHEHARTDACVLCASSVCGPRYVPQNTKLFPLAPRANHVHDITSERFLTQMFNRETMESSPNASTNNTTHPDIIEKFITTRLELGGLAI